MMKVLCWSDSAQDGTDNVAGTRSSPETRVVSRFRNRLPVGIEPAGNPGTSGRLGGHTTPVKRMGQARNLSGGRAAEAYPGVAATFPVHQLLSWWIVPLASLWRGIRGFVGELWTVVCLGLLEHIDLPLCGLAHRPSLGRIPPLPVFPDPSFFSLDDRSARLDRSPDRVRAELNQGLICKQNLLCISRKAGFPKGNGLLDGSTDELRAVLTIAKGFLQAPNSRSIQPQCSLKVQTFWACHTGTIRRGRIFPQIDTHRHSSRYLLLTFKVSLIRIQLMKPVFRFRPFFRRESGAC